MCETKKKTRRRLTSVISMVSQITALQTVAHGVTLSDCYLSPPAAPYLFRCQAFLAAPLFVLCEVLFEFGYKKDMQKRMKAKALLNVQEFQATKSRQAAEKRD